MKDHDRQVSLMISMPKKYRDRLRTMAAKHNLEDPSQVTSAAQIARDIICDFLKHLDSKKED